MSANISWDEYFIELARLVARKSKDRSTKVGAVVINPVSKVILATGYNGFPRGVDDSCSASHERPSKYFVTEHAERNACYNAARHGTSLEGSVLYLNYAPNAICADCARAIIQVGITSIIGPGEEFPGRGDLWLESRIRAEMLFFEVGIKCRVVSF